MIMQNKRQMWIFSAVFSVSIVLLLLYSGYRSIAFDKDYYLQEYSKLGVYQRFEAMDVSKEDAGFQINRTLDFILKKGTLDPVFLDEPSQLHMADVKKLVASVDLFFHLMFALGFISLCLAILYEKPLFPEKILGTAWKVGAGFLVLFVIIAAATAFRPYFEAIFLVFHKIFFPMGNWTFESGSRILTMFPEKLFQHLAVRIFVSGIASTFLMSLIAYSALSLYKKSSIQN